MSNAATVSGSFAPLVLNGQQLNGGLSFNFSLPSFNSIQSQAYNFMSANNTQDFGFLNQTISGSQNFLQNQVSPIIAGAVNQVNANTTYIPQSLSMENNLAQSQMGYEAQLQAQSMADQVSIAQASIASSTASAQAAANSGGGGGGCFITTAVCEFENLPDDCYTLTVLRKFRDDVLLGSGNDEFVSIVHRYYEIAPNLVQWIDSRDDRAGIYAVLRYGFIEPCILHIEHGENAEAIAVYSQMVNMLERMCHE